MKVIVTAGGTGGHIYPALGVIEELESIGAEILYIGTKNRMESTLIPEKGINYVGLEIYGLSKTNILRDIKNVGYIIKSYNTCKKIMKEFKPDYVIGFGGYVTLPVLLAAKNAKIRCGIHEQNKLPGKTNKFLSKYVDETFTSFEVSDKTFKNKVIVTGNPTGSKALNIKPADKTKLGFSKDKKLTIIVMGSLGSQIVNNLLKDFLTNYKNSDNEILFITGKSNYENFKDISVSKNIKIIPYYDDLSSIMKVSDLVISRAGASTISEILSLNKPSILIPPSIWVIKFINRSFVNTKKLTSRKYDSNLMILSSWMGKKYTFCFFPKYLSLNHFISGIKLSIIFFALASASLSFVCISSIFL